MPNSVTVKVQLNEADLARLVEGKADEALELIADDVVRRAKASAAFADKTGGLRKSIKKVRGKYPAENPAWLVKATAPNAHLVEYGHGGPAPAPPHPFLTPARDAAMATAGKTVADELNRITVVLAGLGD